ncbi:MAG TPA: hypothetical protein VFR44_12905 [Actinomycetota bacterium]|nr:hypothetical protein [Actinomycetota bacterium]
MTERWRRVLRRVEDASPSEGVLERARKGPASSVPDRRRTSPMLAVIVAFSLFAASGVLVWNALGQGSGRRDAGPSGDEAVPGPITSQIVFTTQGPDDMTPRIAVMEPDGAYLRVLGPGSEPAWSPDGSRIAFTRLIDDGSTGIYVMNADGSGVARLTTNEQGMDEGPTWSPDGRLIVFSRSEFVTLDPDPIASPARRDLYAVALDGTEPTKLLGGSTDDFSPAWSPDGSTIAFVRMVDPAADGWARISQIWTVATDGSGASQVTTFDKGAWRPAWSPDGSALAFDGGSDIYIVGADGRGLHRIDLPSGWGEEAESPFDPTWSPDGTRIAFTAGGEQGRDIFVAGLDGTDLKDLSGPLAQDAEPMWLMPSAPLSTASPTPPEQTLTTAPSGATGATRTSGPTGPSAPADVLTIREDDDDLFMVTYPIDWFVPATPINDWVCSPYEILALATYPLRPGGEAVTDFQLPSRAVEDLGPNDILIWLNENGSACGETRDSAGPSGFPDRPTHFGPVRVCGDFDLLCPSDGRNLVPGIRGWWIAFNDAGRSFYVFVGMGEEAYANPERQQQAWDALDSLQFLPR